MTSIDNEGILGTPAADHAAEARLAADRAQVSGADGLPARGGELDNSSTRPGIVLHEEQLAVRTERVATQRVRLRRRVVTEERTITVPVRREVIEVVNEPLEPGAPLGEGEFEAEAGDVEMIARSEVPIVTTELVQVERVRLVRRTVTEQREVSDAVRREQAHVEHLPLDGAETTPAAPQDAPRI